ncbi:hypothetical protein IWW50_002104 [Coemansia erecta]|nr:hypothetical protein GGF43_005031 [Coemansia sp. RSA 2618]KAJ2826992.1 hypothetical protein IWW50_002104 [Coemansia erecta]
MSTEARPGQRAPPIHPNARASGSISSRSSTGYSSDEAMDEHSVAQQLQQLVIDPLEILSVDNSSIVADPEETAAPIHDPGNSTPSHGGASSADATWDFLANAAQMFERPAELSEVTGADIGRGFDMQGYRWGGREGQRRMYMEYRRLAYPQYQGVRHDVCAVRERASTVDSTGEFYGFRYAATGDAYRCKINHFQLRDLVWATSSYDVFYGHADGVQKWDPWRRRRGCVVARSEMPEAFRLSALCAGGGVVFAGDYRGRFCVKSLWTRGAAAATGRLALGAEDIVNHATPGRSGRISVAMNSGRVNTFDVQRAAVSDSTVFDWAVNCTAESVSGALACVVGDSTQGLLVDPRQGHRAIAELQGHSDYVFACALSPDERLVATGSQDTSVRVYDVRWPRDPASVLCGHMGAMRVVRFSACGRFMLAAEAADYVHVYETAQFARAQDIGFMGEVAGATFSPDGNCLFVGISDAVHEDALAEFTRISSE